MTPVPLAARPTGDDSLSGQVSKFSVSDDGTTLSVSAVTAATMEILPILCTNVADSHARDTCRLDSALRFYEMALSMQREREGQRRRQLRQMPFHQDDDEEQHMMASDNAASMLEYRIGNVHARLRSYQRSIACHEEVLKFRRRQSADKLSSAPGSNKEVADVLHNLANSYLMIGSYEKAAQCFIEALEERKALVDENSSKEHNMNVANTLYGLGQLHFAMGAYDEGMEAANDAQRTYAQFLGNNNLFVAYVRRLIGDIHGVKAMKFFDDKALPESVNGYEDDFDMVLAKECYRDALRLFKMFLSSEHEEVAGVLFSMGSIHESCGNYEEAEWHFAESLRIRRKNFGDNNLTVATLLHSLGIVYSALRNEETDLDDSIFLLEESLRIRTSLLGFDNEDVGDTLHYLGCVHARLYDNDRALECYKEAVRIRRITNGDFHPSVGKTLNNLGIIYARKRSFQSALACLEEALNIRKEIDSNLDKSSTKDKEEVLNTLFNMGSLQGKMGEYNKSLESFDQVIKIRKSMCMKDDLNVANILHCMGNIYLHKKLFVEARISYEKSLGLKKLFLGDGNASYSNTLHGIGKIHHENGEFDEALAYYEESLWIRKLCLDKDHIDIGLSLFSMGTARLCRCDYEVSMNFYTQALRILRLNLGDDHHDVAKAFQSIATVYDVTGKFMDAEKCYKEALRVYKLEQNEDDIIKVKEALAELRENSPRTCVDSMHVLSHEFFVSIGRLVMRIAEVFDFYLVDPSTAFVQKSITKASSNLENIGLHSIVTHIDIKQRLCLIDDTHPV